MADDNKAANSAPSDNAEKSNDKESEKLTFSFLSKGTTTSTGTVSYPSDLKSITDEIDYVRFKFKIYKPPFTTSTSSPGSYGGYNESAINLDDDDELPTIIMYMPEDVQTEYGTSWGAKSIQNITAAVLRSASGKAGLKEFLDDVGAGAGVSFDAAEIEATKQALKFLQDNGQGEGLGINEILGSTKGVVVNPNTELLFNGFDLRSFNLNFKMVAKSEPEAEDIRTIITAFKAAMLPRLDERKSANEQDGSGQIKGTDRTSFIGIPDLVEIKYMLGSSEHPYVTQYKPCAITSLAVNYTADGAYATYAKGQPVAVTMNVGFSEVKLVYREDIRFGGPSF